MKLKKLLCALLTLCLLAGLLPVSALAAEVRLSPQNLRVNGEKVDCEKYNIDGRNYFKLRDLAWILRDTESRFSVEWDGELGLVSVSAGAEYVPDGSELDLSLGDRSDSAQPSAQSIVIDGEAREDLTVYNIGGNNFFQLRELGDILGFGVDYDAGTNTAVVTSSDYVPESEPERAPEDPLWRGIVAGSSVPALGDSATEENVLALLDAYDPNGAYILRKSGGDYLFWFGGETVSSGVDKAVHEQTHVLSHAGSDYVFKENRVESYFSGYGFYGDYYYVGNGYTIPVEYTEVYNSREMTEIIPERLHTMRYDTYVDTTGNMSSAVQGAYGLMNEFTAYCWGMNNTVSLFDYYRDYGSLEQGSGGHFGYSNDWFQYINAGANDRLAHEEFLYYILTYMIYARDRHPEVYRGILENGDFLEAFREVETVFTANIAAYEESLETLKTLLAAKGYRAGESGGYYYIGNYGVGIFREDYDALCAAVAEPEYQAMYELMMKG